MLWAPLSVVIVGGVIVAFYVGSSSSRFIEVALAIGIAAASGTGIRFISDSQTALDYSDLRYLTSAIAIMLSLAALTKLLPALAREFWWLLTFVFALISLAWVTNVTSSLMTYSGWVCVVLIGALLATSFDREKASAIVLNVMFWTSLASLVLILFVPSLGRIAAQRPDGVTEQMAIGVFAWNSELGLSSGVGTVLATAFWFTKRPRKKYLVQAALMAGVTVVSDSATGLLALVAGLVATVWACVPKLRKIVVAMALVAGVLWTTGGIDAISAYVLNLVSRSATLSGRSVIWQIALDLFWEHPVGGYGIGASPNLQEFLGFSAHAHNGYIQLLLELGVIGAALIGVGLLVTAVRTLKCHSPLLGVLTVVLVSNVANNYLVTSNVAVAVLAWVAFEMAKPRAASELKVVLPKLPKARKTKRPDWADRPNAVIHRDEAGVATKF